MDVFYAYTFGSAGWLCLQAVPLLLSPKVITTLLGPEGHRRTDLEVYFGRFLGLALVLIALIMMLLTGSIPLTSSASEPVSMEDADPKAPYAVPVLRLTTIFHGLAATYCYTSYVSLRQTGFMLGAVGYGALAAMGLWCVMFATSGGKISRRTGADKRTSGFPFTNEKAYNKRRRLGVKGHKSSQTLMEAVTDPSLQAIPVSLRNLQPATFQPPHPLTSQLGPQYDPTGFHQYDINEVQHVQVGGQVQAFPHPRQSLQTPITYPNGSFGVVHPGQQHQQPIPFQVTQDGSPTKEVGGHFNGMKAVPSPPDLQQWRQKLFNVNELITLTEDEFQTYFPHVDNIYSHRSTQRYKRKPFVSHYWDCRLKGRPPGTPKTDDPGKKKRRRIARQRDLCDVKIKITEYFPGAAAMMAQPDFGAGVDAVEFMQDGREPAQPFGVLAPSSTLPAGHPGAGGARYYTIQRVNGGASGKENEGGGHKHSMEESDAIKKNSVKRKMLKEEKEKKRMEAANKSNTSSAPNTSMTTTKPGSSSGLAALTAQHHSKPADLIFFGNLFCPFAQRVWIALEVKEVPYQYVETDSALPLPAEMVEVNPDKRLPCIKHGNWGAWESSIIMEYFEDLSMGHSLLPLGDPQLRAHCRMWADHINRKIIPSFDSLLITSSPDKQSALTTTLQSAITDLVNAGHATGPFFLGPNISFVDVMFAPWIIRLSRVLKYYRQWPDPEVGTRWETWVQAVEADERVKRTVSEEREYQVMYAKASKGVAAHGMLGWAFADGVVDTVGVGEEVMGE